MYMMEELNSSNRKRVRDESDDSRFESPEVKRIKEDLLENFDDDTEFLTASHELDSFMKSFEEEISSSSGSTSTEESAASASVVVDLISESGDSQPELGYLLEASDDELGIPPSRSDVEKDELTSQIAPDSGSAEFGNELWRYDEGIANFDSLEFGIGDCGSYYNNPVVVGGGSGGGEYVALDGLFDYSDVGFGSSDYLWRPETLPAK